MDAHEDAGHSGGGGGGGGGGEGSCGALESLPPLLLDPGPRDPGQQLAPDLQLIDALLRHPGGGGESAPADADADAARAGDAGAGGAAAHAAAMRRAAAALGARHCCIAPALLEALLAGGGSAGGGSGAAATAHGDAGSGCVLVAAPNGRLRLRSLREAVLRRRAGPAGAEQPLAAAAAASEQQQDAGAGFPQLVDLGQPLVGAFPLSLASLTARPDASASAAGSGGGVGGSDALLLLGARGRVLLLYAAPAPRLPPALAPLLRVLHASSGGGLCVNSLGAAERQLPLQLWGARLVPPAEGGGPPRLALLSRRGALHSCALGPREGRGGGAGGGAPPLPERLELAPLPAPARAAALADGAAPGHVAAVAADGRRFEVAVGGAVLAPPRPERARAQVGAVVAGLERLDALREALQLRGAALDAEADAAGGELRLLGGPGWAAPQPTAGARPAVGLAPLAAAAAGGGPWSACGALRARLLLERAWAAPAAAAGCGGAGAAAWHLAVRAELATASPCDGLGPGWQLLIQWVPERSGDPGWQSGAALAPLPAGAACAASLLLPLPAPAAGAAPLGGWLQLLLVRPGGGGGGGMRCSSCALPAFAVAARLRVPGLCVAQLLREAQQGCCALPGGAPGALSLPAAWGGCGGPAAAPTPQMPRRCLLHLQLDRTGAAAKRRRVAAGGGGGSSEAAQCQRERADEGPKPCGGSALLAAWLEAALRGPVARGNTVAGPAAAAAPAGRMRLQSGDAAVAADWGPPQPPPGAAGPAAGVAEALVLRLQASDAPRLAQAHGALSEALRAQLLRRACAGEPDEGPPGAAAACALESDRPRLQDSLRRLQQLRGRVAGLRAQLAEALRLRDAADRTGGSGCGIDGGGAGGGGGGGGVGCEGAADGAERLVAAAARLRAGVEAAYGQSLLAADDARRVVLAAGVGGGWRDC
ncbi:hypothetical protein Rsub_01641 [Raphidocelis subcapitata]|uniref:Uncharacterized protein n=1 Tax=Raphidocelis subcapitata TaxID=307507 RepID=A0A2V0NT46_9CHLO|nr:hypothetical protein Rsub_01641 [Raphidocelis subcapitata]|eukprot:GBF88740.1 hypothetical protein Rsub_01641 [Raphidocelis subcapitata]